MNIFRKRRDHLGGEMLSEYLSGRLTPEEARRVETHVDACAACREELNSLGSTVGLMRRVPMASPRTTFVLLEAPIGGPPRGWVSRLPGWAYGAAASLAAIVFVVVLSADMGGLLTEDAVTRGCGVGDASGNSRARPAGGSGFGAGPRKCRRGDRIPGRSCGG